MQENLVTPEYLQKFIAASQAGEEATLVTEAEFAERATHIRTWCLENLFSNNLNQIDVVIDFFQELDWDTEAFQEYEIVELMQENSDSESQQLDDEGSLGSEFDTGTMSENTVLSFKNHPQNLKILVETCVHHFYNPYRLEIQPKLLQGRNTLFRDHFFKPLLQAMLDRLIEEEPSRFSEFVLGTYIGSDGERTSAHFSDGYFFAALERFLDLTETSLQNWSELLKGIVEVLYVFDTYHRISGKEGILRACDLITRALQGNLCPSENLPALFNELCWILNPSKENLSYTFDDMARLCAPLQATLELTPKLSENAGSCEAPLVILLAQCSKTELALPLVRAFLQKCCPDYLMSTLSTREIAMEDEHLPPLLTLYQLLLEELTLAIQNPQNSSSVIQSLFDLILEKLTKDQYQEVLIKILNTFDTEMEEDLINHLVQALPSLPAGQPLACDYFRQTHTLFLEQETEEEHSPRTSATGILGHRSLEESSEEDHTNDEPPYKRAHT